MSRPCKLCNLKSIVIVRLWSLKLGDSGMFWQHKNILLSKSILFEKEGNQSSRFKRTPFRLKICKIEFPKRKPI